MIVQPIDPEICAALLRNVTDRLAAVELRSAPELDLPTVISRVKQVSNEAAAVLRSQLNALYPQIGWSDEDDRPEGGDSAYWLYDPVDGAYHYLQNLPLWAASLVLMQNGQAVFSIVYDATMQECFIARAGAGASCNGKPVQVAAKTDASTAVGGTAIPPLAQVGDAEQDEALALIGTMMKTLFVVRPMAAVSLQLAYVAAGRLDVYWENGNDAADWLAGALLVREAGGLVSDLKGDAFGWEGDGIIAGNAALHAQLKGHFSRALATRDRPSMARYQEQ